jgi:hypothetical protein
MIKQNSETKSESDKYAKIAKIEAVENSQKIEVFSTEKIYRIIYNKNLIAKITIINEEN